MNDIQYFQKFVAPKKNNKSIKPKLFVWTYTRVSSKDQYDKNSSVERQLEASKNYANEKKYQITEEFGGTYESGKSDFTRKEFTRLIEKVKTSRNRPLAVLVYKMSRFSRSGGGAIGLVNTLVEELGVHLIEVCSGQTTMTDRGKISIYESLFHAHKENLEKKEIIIPGMIASLKTGIWFGVCPIGYDRYGRRVANQKFFSFKQRIVINKDGRLLKEAWNWKVSGLYSDAQIISRLAVRGLKISKQKMSHIWRTPFYAGILVNRLLDAPVKGSWPSLVNRENFIKVQQILENNPSGFQHNKNEEMRPLTRLLRCNECGSFMVGYRNNKKNLHYYRCQKCNGVSINAITTIKAKRKGANDLFLDYLKKYAIPDWIIPIVNTQIIKIYNNYNQGNANNEDALTNQMDNLEKKLKGLKIRHGLCEIDRETYDLTFTHLNDQISAVANEIKNTQTPKISNLEKLLSGAINKLHNIHEIWQLSRLDGKRRIQKILFPEGILYDAKNHQYLTKKTNSFLYLTRCVSDGYKDNNREPFQFFPEKSYLVSGSGLEPPTFGL
ncbi:MAG TPA: recombinase family protein [Hanamia sp.]|nr:recombinase family protein [Hanamia sp.]